MKHILVIRFSAMGDVILTLPVIRSILNANTNLEITVVTKKPFAVLLSNIERLHVVIAEVDEKHKSIFGIKKLYDELTSSTSYDAVIDLHDVIRSRILSLLFRLSGTPIFRINKDRRSKKRMIATKELGPLMHTTQRYLEVFEKAGITIPSYSFAVPNIAVNEQDIRIANDFLSHHKHNFIGIAPFAKHATKTLPIEKSEELIRLLSENHSIFLLGGKEDENQFLKWEKQFPSVHSTVSLSLLQQTALLSSMKAVISMDSANMHLAAVQGIPVISIWGATHPYFGFSGIGTDKSTWISTHEHLPCRPCSVFGNKPCSNTSSPMACMNGINVAEIAQKVIAITRG